MSSHSRLRFFISNLEFQPFSLLENTSIAIGYLSWMAHKNFKPIGLAVIGDLDKI